MKEETWTFWRTNVPIVGRTKMDPIGNKPFGFMGYPWVLRSDLSNQ